MLVPKSGRHSRARPVPSPTQPLPLGVDRRRRDLGRGTEPDLNRLASAWHTDADLGRPIEVVTDMGKSRKLGFLDYQATDDSFFDLFNTLRQARIIP